MKRLPEIETTWSIISSTPTSTSNKMSTILLRAVGRMLEQESMGHIARRTAISGGGTGGSLEEPEGHHGKLSQCDPNKEFALLALLWFALLCIVVLCFACIALMALLWFALLSFACIACTALLCFELLCFALL